MVINTFTYYEHLKALDKILVSQRFIDGETYVISEITSYYKNYVLRGNFYVNMTVLEGGSWRYRDVIKEQGIRIDGKDFKKIMSIVKPLKFKKISK